MKKDYLIICLRHNYDKRDNLVFWGKNSCGYFEDITKAHLYTKEEAKIICKDCEDCPISLKDIGISFKELSNINYPKHFKLCVIRTDEICNYINKFKKNGGLENE